MRGHRNTPLNPVERGRISRDLHREIPRRWSIAARVFDARRMHRVGSDRRSRTGWISPRFARASESNRKKNEAWPFAHEIVNKVSYLIRTTFVRDP